MKNKLAEELINNGIDGGALYDGTAAAKQRARKAYLPFRETKVKLTHTPRSKIIGFAPIKGTSGAGGSPVHRPVVAKRKDGLEVIFMHDKKPTVGLLPLELAGEVVTKLPSEAGIAREVAGTTIVITPLKQGASSYKSELGTSAALLEEIMPKKKPGKKAKAKVVTKAAAKPAPGKKLLKLKRKS
jgi:hypothetical protein